MLALRLWRYWPNAQRLIGKCTQRLTCVGYPLSPLCFAPGPSAQAAIADRFLEFPARG